MRFLYGGFGGRGGIEGFFERIFGAGEGRGEVIVTERGRPIARIVPVKLDEGAEWERLREMERAGEVRIGSGKVPDEFFEMRGAEDPEGKVRSALMEEREEGR